MLCNLPQAKRTEPLTSKLRSWLRRDGRTDGRTGLPVRTESFGNELPRLYGLTHPDGEGEGAQVCSVQREKFNIICDSLRNLGILSLTSLASF